MAKREVRAWKLSPAFDPLPGSLHNSGTTTCIASGEYLLGTDIGEALSPKIVSQLRKTDKARTILDAELIDAAIEFLCSPNLKYLTIGGQRLTATDIADKLRSRP